MSLKEGDEIPNVIFIEAFVLRDYEIGTLIIVLITNI